MGPQRRVENNPEAVLSPEEVRAPEVAISNTLEAVSPPKEVKTPEVAVIKPPKVVFPPEEDITPEVAHGSIEAKDPFRPRKEDEDSLGPKVPYLSAIGALMYLANNTRPDIAYFVNLLARLSSNSTKRHWDGIKNIFRYLRGTIDLGLFFPHSSKSQLTGYADVGYMSDPYFGRSQTGYLFTYCGTAISWKSTKQTMAATSSNHAELLAIHEASRECIWLRYCFGLIKQQTHRHRVCAALDKEKEVGAEKSPSLKYLKYQKKEENTNYKVRKGEREPHGNAITLLNGIKAGEPEPTIKNHLCTSASIGERVHNYNIIQS
ncbi:hypothetical protein AgCh_017888 [Apium graveolens]